MKRLVFEKVELFWAVCFCMVFISFFFLSGSHAPVLNLDNSWEVALEYAFKHNFQFGRDVVFTYGPLGFLNTWTSLGHLIEVRTIFALFWSGIVAWAIIGLARQIVGPLKFVFLGWSLIFTYNGLPDLNVLLVMVFCCTVLMGDIHRHRLASALCLIVFALLALIKFTFFLAAIIGITVCAGVHCGERDFRAAGITVIVFAGMLISIWLSIGQHITGFVPWVRGSMEITSGYSSAMAVRPHIKIFVVGVAAGSLFFVAVGIIIRSVCLHLQCYKVWGLLTVLASYLFLIWKNGFVRADNHVFIFLLGLPLLYAVLLIKTFHENLSGRSRFSLAVIYWGVIFLCLFGAHSQENGMMLGKLLRLPQQVAVNTQMILKILTGDLRGNFASLQIDKPELMLPDLHAARRLIGQESVDVLNNIQWVVFANELAYRPRPIFQGYGVYTPKLQDMNLAFFRGDRRPEWLLYRMDPLDNHFPSLEDATVLPQILNTYRPIAADGSFLVLRNTGRSQADIDLTLPQERNLAFGEELDLKPFNNYPVFLQVDVRPTLFGRLIKFFFQQAPMSLSVKINGKPFIYSFIPAMATRGFLISPVIETNDDIIDFLMHKTGNRPDSIQFSIPGYARCQFFNSISVKIYQARGFPVEKLSEKELSDMSSLRKPTFDPAPVNIDNIGPVVHVDFKGEPALQVSVPSHVVLAIPEGSREFSGYMGALENVYMQKDVDSHIDFYVEIENSEGNRRKLLRKILRPGRDAQDRGRLLFKVPIANQRDKRLILAVGNIPGSGSYSPVWSECRFDHRQ
jgi:hypothetical protein